MRAPLGSLRRQAPSEPELRRKAHLTVHRPSACSGVKALRNTSDARAASRQAALAFRSLDPFRALREPDRRRRDEERLSRSEQRTVSKNPQNNLLTGKAPYKSAANLTADYLIVLGETPRLAEQPRIALSPLIGEGSAAALPSNLDELVAIGVTKISEISAIWTHAGRILD